MNYFLCSNLSTECYKVNRCSRNFFEWLRNISRKIIQLTSPVVSNWKHVTDELVMNKFYVGSCNASTIFDLIRIFYLIRLVPLMTVLTLKSFALVISAYQAILLSTPSEKYRILNKLLLMKHSFDLLSWMITFKKNAYISKINTTYLSSLSDVFFFFLNPDDE